MFTDGSRLGYGATGYAVVWKRGQSWMGIKTHVGHNLAPVRGMRSRSGKTHLSTAESEATYDHRD